MKEGRAEQSRAEQTAEQGAGKKQKVESKQKKRTFHIQNCQNIHIFAKDRVRKINVTTII